MKSRIAARLGIFGCVVTVLAAATARAGIYDVTFSGGSVVVTTNGVAGPPKAYTRGFWQSDDNTFGGGADCPANGKVECSGPISVTFTWHPTAGEAPPNSVIIKERVAAQWTALTGTCDNGIGTPPTNISPTGNLFVQSSNGIKYVIKDNPGQSFTITVNPAPTPSPKVTASRSTGGGGGFGGGTDPTKIQAPGSHRVAKIASAPQTYVYYKVEAISKIDLSLRGQRDFGTSQKILVGQPLEATITIDASYNAPGDYIDWYLPSGFTDPDAVQKDYKPSYRGPVSTIVTAAGASATQQLLTTTDIQPGDTLRFEEANLWTLATVQSVPDGTHVVIDQTITTSVNEKVTRMGKSSATLTKWLAPPHPTLNLQQVMKFAQPAQEVIISAKYYSAKFSKPFMLSRKVVVEAPSVITWESNPQGVHSIGEMELGTNEVRQITTTGAPTGGTWTLTTTIDGQNSNPQTVAFNASPEQVKAAIGNTLTIGADQFSVTGVAGSNYEVTFSSYFTGRNIDFLVDGSQLSGGSSPAVTTQRANPSPEEDPSIFRLTGATKPGSPVNGVYYDAWVVTPSTYTAGTANHGEFEWVQLVTSNVIITESGIPHSADPTINTGEYLDGIFPFNSQQRIADPQNGAWLTFYDRPGVFSQGTNTFRSSNYTMIDHTQTFRLFLFYLGPSNVVGDPSFVSLKLAPWRAVRSTQLSSGTNKWVLGTPGSKFEAETQWPVQPTWTQVKDAPKKEN